MPLFPISNSFVCIERSSGPFYTHKTVRPEFVYLDSLQNSLKFDQNFYSWQFLFDKYFPASVGLTVKISDLVKS